MLQMVFNTKNGDDIMQSLLFSIIVPVYKVERFISQCLESLFDDNVPKKEYEVIVVNDGSPDNSLEIISEIAQIHSNIVIVNQQNMGLSAARNAGFKLARGKYVWFVDSDDWLVENGLFMAYQTLKENSVDIVMTPLLKYYEYTGLQERDCICGANVVSGKEYLQCKGFPNGAIQRFIIKKSYIDSNQLQFKEGILHEDALYGFQLLYPAKSVLVLNEPIYNYRIRSSGSIMSSVKSKNLTDLILIHQELMQYAQTIEQKDFCWYVIRIFTCIDLFCDFTRLKVNNIEILKVYFRYNIYIRIEALRLIVLGKFVKGLLYFISPLLASKIRSK